MAFMAPTKTSKFPELWQEAWEAIAADPDQCRLIDKFRAALSKDKTDNSELTSNDGRRELLQVIRHKSTSMKSSSKEGTRVAFKAVSTVRGLVVTGASPNPCATIAVAGFFIAFDLIEYYRAEKARVYTITLDTADIICRFAPLDHLVKSLPNEHSQLQDARDGLHRAFVKLYRTVFELTMKVVYRFDRWGRIAVMVWPWNDELMTLEGAERRVDKYVAAVNVALNHPPPSTPNWPPSNNKITILHRHVQHGQFTHVYNMIIAGQCTPDVLNAQTSKGWTPLMFAAKDGQWKILNLLLSVKGVATNIKNCDGNTALILAAQNDRPGHVRKLIEGGAKVGIRNNGKRTAWLEAAIKGRLKAMKVLLEKGDDINQLTGKNGWCVLHTAVEKNYEELAKWLLEKKANTDIKVRNGKRKGLTPRELAEKMIAELDLEIKVGGKQGETTKRPIDEMVEEKLKRERLMKTLP